MTKLWRILGYAILAALLSASLPSNLLAEESQGAKIANIDYLQRLYDGGNQTFTINVENKGLVSSNGQGNFFMRLWSDNLVIYDESGQYWSIYSGSATIHKITLENLRGPKSYTIKLELYWHNQTDILVDSTTAVFKVVRLFVDGWSFSQVTVTRGAETPALLNITFRNGGNDAMTNVEIELADTAKLSVAPLTTKNLGDLQPGQTSSILVPVKAPADIDLGVQAIRFQITYHDFAGIQHQEYANATLTVVRMRVGILLKLPDKAEYGEITKLSAILTDQSGKPLAAEVLNFYLGSKMIGAATTDVNGNATIEHRVDLDAGSYKAGVLYDGSNEYDPAEAASYIKIDPAQTHLVVNAPQTVKVAKTAVVDATLADQFGIPLSDRHLSFYVNGSLVGVIDTDASGRASIQYTPVSQGSLEVEVRFSGDTNHVSRIEDTRVLVAPLASVLRLKYPSMVLGASTVVVEAELLDETGLPIPQAQIMFYRIEGNQSRSLGTALTDYTGEASIEYTPDSDGQNSVQVVYAGNALYSAAADTANLFILGQVMIGAIVGGALAGAGGALALAMRFRERFHNLLSWRRARLREGRKSVPQKKAPQVKPVPIEGPEHSEFVPLKKQLDEIDSRVLSYIVDHGGVISRARAAGYLGISEEDLLAATERLKRLGKLV